MRKLFNSFKKVVLVCAVATLVISCNKNDPPTDPTLSTDAPAEIVFNADGTGGKDVITITTNSPSWNFTLTPNDAWLTASASDNELSLVASPNTSTDVPPAVELKITAGEATPVVITVKQSANVLPVAFHIEGLTGEVEVVYTDGTKETAIMGDKTKCPKRKTVND